MYSIVASGLLGTILMLAGIFLKQSKNVQALAIIASIVLMIASIVDYNIASSGETSYFNNMILVNKSIATFNLWISFGMMAYIFIFHKSIAGIGIHNAEYFALLFFCIAGVYMVTTYNNLVILFLGIEAMSIPQYILAGSDKRSLKSNEASLKYFLMGAFSTGFLLMGIALLYGASGSFDTHLISVALKNGDTTLTIMGIGFLIIAFGFKSSLAPFHIWTPDVYDGTPTPITPFMASIVKVGIFYAFIKFFHVPLEFRSESWQYILLGLFMLTLLIGNVTAVYQQSVKRMLAYSSIAQAGFMLLGVYSFGYYSDKGIIMYAAAYILASIAVFALLMNANNYTYEGFKGLAKRNPVLAFTSTIGLFSLAGIPLTGGFFAKYYMLTSAAQNGAPIAVLIFSVLMAAISVFYYFKLIRAMYFQESDKQDKIQLPKWQLACLIVNAIAIIILGIFPSIIGK